METIFDTSTRRRSSGRGSGKARKGGAPRGPRRRLGWFLWLLRALFNLALVLSVAALATVLGMYAYVKYQHEGQNMEGYPSLPQNSTVYDANGEEIAEFAGAENRWTVPYDDLGPHLPRAIVAVEDMRFYEHPGFSFESIGRAAMEDIRARDIQQGGSTITEQLVKNLYIDQERRGNTSFWRRFEQAVLSFEYERKHTKREILTTYLNTIYFGGGAYGAEAAARSYFGKSASEMTLPEAAAIASFLDQPSLYRQDGELEGSARAKESRDTVLRLMMEQGMISEEDMWEARNTPLKFAPPPPEEDQDFANFTDQVYREVREEVGEKALQRGGLRVFTTLNPEMQKEAIAASEEVLYLEDDPAGGIATVDPQTGAVRALAGREGEFNLAVDARRQPGSSFKPFVLAAALRGDISPQTTYLSRTFTFPFNGEEVTVGNYDEIERGPITVREAMAESDNSVFVQFALDLGLSDVTETARAMGITSDLNPYPSTAIGGLEEGVSPLQMASAYSTFAAGGIHREPYTVERVEHVDFGERETVHDHRVQGMRVLSSTQAAVASEVLRGVVTDGTASMFHDLDEEIGRPSVGKTGTTDDFVDAWYVGYTPRLATAVWVGYPEGRTPMRDVHGEPVVNGENLPMDIWSLYMAQATSDDPALDFPDADESELRLLNRGYARNPYLYRDAAGRE